MNEAVWPTVVSYCGFVKRRTRVELANYYQQEQLVQLLEGVCQQAPLVHLRVAFGRLQVGLVCSAICVWQYHASLHTAFRAVSVHPLPRSITYLRADFVQQGQRIGQQRSLLLHQCGLGVVHQPHLAQARCSFIVPLVAQQHAKTAE